MSQRYNTMTPNTFDVLEDVVQRVKCKRGWSFEIVDEEGALRLVIQVRGFNSATPEDNSPYYVRHFFPVPTTTYNVKSWTRWVFEMCRRLENHELGEWFRIDDKIRPFAPMHGPGEDPYTVHEIREELDALTTQDGSMRVKEPPPPNDDLGIVGGGLNDRAKRGPT